MRPVRTMPLTRITPLAAAFAAALLMAPSPARSQVVEPEFWGTDADVHAVACSGNTVYIGGNFTSLGPCTGGGVPLHAATGKPLHGFPKVAGSVYGAVPDGEGGWFIAGSFDAVSGVRHVGLAHVLADGGVAAWDPHFPSSNNIFALALRGHTLYVGGGFTKPGTGGYTAVAAIDARTGAVLPWAPQVHGWVFCLALSDSTLYVGWSSQGLLDTLAPRLVSCFKLLGTNASKMAMTP